jgi:hypothetical protein
MAPERLAIHKPSPPSEQRDGGSHLIEKEYRRMSTKDERQMSTSLKVREARARRKLLKLGYGLEKTPARSWLRHYGAGYQISQNNFIVAGCYQREYELTIEQVEDFAAKPWNQ